MREALALALAAAGTLVVLAGAPLGASENLPRRDLRGARLAGADLARANLQRADRRDAQLEGARLALANLQRADLRGARLGGADLTGADLTGADLGGARGLTRAQVESATTDGTTRLPLLDG